MRRNCWTRWSTPRLAGEEEIWSHTDLSDFQGNIDGARVAYEDVLPILKQKDPKLAEDIAKKFDAVQKLLNQHKKGKWFLLPTREP